MHVGRLPLLLTAALLCSLAQAEELQRAATAPESAPALSAPTSANEALIAQLDQLQRQLARLRTENQRLKLQVKEAQASQSPRLLSEQQTWFAVGGGVALLSLFTGLIARGGRRQRRQWIN